MKTSSFICSTLLAIFCIVFLNSCAHSLFDFYAAQPDSIISDSHWTGLNAPGTVITLADEGVIECVPVTSSDIPYATALRAHTKDSHEKKRFAYKIPITHPLPPGMFGVASFYARAVTSAPNTAAQVSLELLNLNGRSCASYTAKISNEWTLVRIPFVTETGWKARHYHPTNTVCVLNFGFPQQTIDIAGFSVKSLGTETPPPSELRSTATYPGRSPDAAWRKEAEQRIHTYRTAPLSITIVDKKGVPVTNAEVHVEQQKHAFGFGTCFVARHIMTNTPDAQMYKHVITQLFNRVVTENDLKMKGWHGDWTWSNRKTTLDALRWMQEKDIYVRGHTMVWGSKSHLPAKWLAYTNQPQKLRVAISNHIADIAVNTRGLIDEWDVVNEPFSHNEFTQLLGTNILCEWFNTARHYLPDALLFINDFSILIGPATCDSEHQKHYADTIRYLQKIKAPLDGIGFQSHFWGYNNMKHPQNIYTILDHYAQFNTKLEVTEYDLGIADEELQAEYLRDILTIVFSHPDTSGFVRWGFWEGAQWRSDGAMFRRDWTPKLNVKAYQELVHNKWWTDEIISSDANGTCSVRGYLGDYKVTVTTDRGTRTFPATLPRGGTAMRVIMDN